MPTCGYASPIDLNPRLWEKCRQTVGQQMIESGWSKHALKFSEVQRKRARKLFEKSI